MAEPDDLPEPDRIEGAPHPRETGQLVGHAAAEAAFLDAYNAGRLHHAWLITGPRGVGKATLAWKIARFLRAAPAPGEVGLFGEAPTPATLEIAADHPVARRSRALAEPGIFLLRRGPRDKPNDDKIAAEILVKEVRRMRAFFDLSVIDGGRRVVIVDAADEMNPQAANALLKSLEEPPSGTVFLLVSHQPSRLLPTIRSRCRALRLDPLAAPDLARALEGAGLDGVENTEALGELAGGSVGEALQLFHQGGLEAYREIVATFANAPRYDRLRAIALANSATGAANATRFDLVLRLFALFLARLARAGAGHLPAFEAAPGEAALLGRLAPDARAGRVWAGLQQELTARAAHGRAVNLDPAAVILDMVFRINEAAEARVA
ncbi:DNA polymerase III subunit delta' [Sinisalibacter lacisalsi]|uniref:DNA polymerase III subunit delta n=1 Tax=Sinisalibacter lacisalsi TaxID=1526570 RepID=A0ABQ1QV32_9RHOB|nr:DNA polymerase III subunit delta' [Sinisalibacter lacisalsi]GGD45322.1 DNA polymerase III subunit delta' [Sinisalibacter lacisalsi]